MLGLRELRRGKPTLTVQLSWLRRNGIDSVLSYISRSDSAKCMDVGGLQALIKAGIIYGDDSGSPEFGDLGCLDQRHLWQI
jgi:hypothetical protein